MKVAKWGNSLAVRLPKETAEVLGVSEGDDIAFVMTADGDVKLSKQLDMKAWAESLKKYQGRLPPGFPAPADLVWTGTGHNNHWSRNRFDTSDPGMLP